MIAVALLAITAVASFGFWRVVRERDRAEARRLEAVDNLRQARGAVDRMLTRVSEEKIRGVPHSSRSAAPFWKTPWGSTAISPADRMTTPRWFSR